jgi:integrase
VAKRRTAEYEVSSINRALQLLRRILRLAVEWGKSEHAAPRVSLLPGERRRERVLNRREEAAYSKAAQEIGEGILQAYQQALGGIRATARGERPIEPEDPYLLRYVSAILLDCGLRPEQCYRLKWEQYRDGALHIPFGKTACARRSVPLPKRGESILEMRRTVTTSEWIFPSPLRAGISSHPASRNSTARLVLLPR